MGKVILITGGCGFVGSQLAIQFKRQNPGYRVLAFDNLSRRGAEINLKAAREQGVEFIHGDVRNREDFEKIPEVTDVIDAAAEPSVSAGLGGSVDYVLQTNLWGTINAARFAARHGAAFIFLSTSRVYSIAELERIQTSESETRYVIDPDQSIKGVTERGIDEKFPIQGYRSLYGASKLSSELILQEFDQFMELKVAISRFGLIAGPHQMGRTDQGVVALWVARHYWKNSLSYIGFGGEGKQVRDVLDIEDVFRLVDYQIHNIDIVRGAVLNAGGGLENSISLRELTGLCQEITGNKIPIQKVRQTRPADIKTYVTNNGLISGKTEWKPRKAIRETVEAIFEWIHSNERRLKPVLSTL